MYALLNRVRLQKLNFIKSAGAPAHSLIMLKDSNVLDFYEAKKYSVF